MSFVCQTFPGDWPRKDFRYAVTVNSSDTCGNFNVSTNNDTHASASASPSASPSASASASASASVVYWEFRQVEEKSINHSLHPIVRRLNHEFGVHHFPGRELGRKNSVQNTLGEVLLAKLGGTLPKETQTRKVF